MDNSVVFIEGYTYHHHRKLLDTILQTLATAKYSSNSITMTTVDVEETVTTQRYHHDYHTINGQTIGFTLSGPTVVQQHQTEIIEHLQKYRINFLVGQTTEYQRLFEKPITVMKSS